MNDISKPTNFQPILEIALYRAGLQNMNESVDGRSEYYHALTASIEVVNGVPVRGEWQNFRNEDAKLLREAFSSIRHFGKAGLLPSSILAAKSDGYCWWVPVTKRPLFLVEELAEKTGLEPDASCQWPGLIFISTATEGNKVFAYKDKSKPDANTELFKPPFWNVTPNGSICFGTEDINRKLNAADFVTSYEKAFFDSKFSYEAGEYAGADRLDDLTLAEGWAKAAKGKFPVKKLKSAGMNLGELLAKHDF